MEKMNQVSVSEFMNLTKTQMYDKAVEMVEKYNRLVDICNDSAERMAEFMAKDDINEFKKELQSKAPGEFKIQKLADIAVWADGKIRDGGYNEEKYNNDGATAYCHVKANELWRIRDVALETMERQTVYSNALNQDIADKAAKIDLLEKEIEGRKKAFNDLREEMANRYIAIETHNDICKTYEKKVAELERQNKYLTEELEKTYAEKEADLKNHNKRDMTLVDELSKKEEETEVKDLKEPIIFDEYHKYNWFPCGEDAIE